MDNPSITGIRNAINKIPYEEFTHKAGVHTVISGGRTIYKSSIEQHIGNVLETTATMGMIRYHELIRDIKGIEGDLVSVAQGAFMQFSHSKIKSRVIAFLDHVIEREELTRFNWGDRVL